MGKKKPLRKPNPKNALQHVHIRLFVADVETLRDIADERGTKWQTELRLLVRRGVRGERREVIILKETS